LKKQGIVVKPKNWLVFCLTFSWVEKLKVKETAMTQAVNMISSYNDSQLVEDDQSAVIFSHGMSLKDIEKSVILETLRRQHFNRTRTARVLGIGIRTLQRKLKFYKEHDGDVIADFERI
jgi:DNA-binding NtrC family response regulator